MRELRIDPEFRDKIPPLTEEEFQQLEDNILEDGVVLQALIVWEDVIVDGHNRYTIIQKYPELDYHIYEKAFPDRYAAIAWICKNQLGRRNLTPQQKKYLVGQQYEAEKMSHGGDRKSEVTKSSPQNEHLILREKTSHSYVEHAGKYAKGVDAAEEALPGMKQELLSGAIQPTEAAVAAVAKAPLEERHPLAEALRETKGSEIRRASPKTATQ